MVLRFHWFISDNFIDLLLETTPQNLHHDDQSNLIDNGIRPYYIPVVYSFDLAPLAPLPGSEFLLGGDPLLNMLPSSSGTIDQSSASTALEPAVGVETQHADPAGIHEKIK